LVHCKSLIDILELEEVIISPLFLENKRSHWLLLSSLPTSNESSKHPDPAGQGLQTMSFSVPLLTPPA
jgi:hypothetical protein